MPAHTSKEILVIFSSLTTCDPGNIYELIKVSLNEFNGCLLLWFVRCVDGILIYQQSLNGLKIRVSVIGLSAEVRVCTILTRETGGW